MDKEIIWQIDNIKDEILQLPGVMISEHDCAEIAKWHIQRTLEARIDELKSIVMCAKGAEQIALAEQLSDTQDERIKDLESQLQQLKDG